MPLFTDFTFDNLGVPRSPENPFYDMGKVYLDNGDAIIPFGEAWIYYGLDGFLQSSGIAEWEAMVPENMVI